MMDRIWAWIANRADAADAMRTQYPRKKDDLLDRLNSEQEAWRERMRHMEDQKRMDAREAERLGRRQ